MGIKSREFIFIIDKTSYYGTTTRKKLEMRIEVSHWFNRNHSKERRGVYEKEIFHSNNFFNYSGFRAGVCWNDV